MHTAYGIGVSRGGKFSEYTQYYATFYRRLPLCHRYAPFERFAIVLPPKLFALGDITKAMASIACQVIIDWGVIIHPHFGLLVERW